jgi:tetratricopeptide (TPR) repeat protein
LIVVIVFLAVAGAATAGWWYAQQSSPHPGPIVLISVDGLGREQLAAYGATATDAPSIDALAADGVVFERAYTHSTMMLPAHASMLAGQLPFEHGVRDEAGFSLPDEARPLAELLQNRGFETGAAVSSFLLRRESGVAQGFEFYDAVLPESQTADAPTVERDGDLTASVAERWLRTQRGQRFFLFLQVDRTSADTAVTRLVQQLKERELYEQATIVLTADRGSSSGFILDDATLRVPLIVKQPDLEGAGRRVTTPVQHIDLVPTVLDFVRAPIPSGLSGRSLRGVLDGEEDAVIDQPIYSESLAARFRLGDQPLFAITTRAFRFVRGAGEQLVELSPAPEDPPPTELDRERARLDFERFAEAMATPVPYEIPAADEDRYAALGYLPGGLVTGAMPPAELQSRPLAELEALVQSHRAAARLAGEQRYGAAIERLRAIARSYPTLTVVHYQIGTLLSRSGRVSEAVASLRTAAAQQPDNPYIAVTLAQVLARGNRLDAAVAQASLAVALAERRDGRAQAAAHATAARIALRRMDAEAAIMHAESARAADPQQPLPQLVNGTLLSSDDRHAEAIEAFADAERVLRDSGRVMEDLHLAYALALMQLERNDEAETHLREELLAFPRNLRAYAALAAIYRGSARVDDANALVAALIEALPTPEGYATAARLWMIMGDRPRAAALSAEARSRFRGDPSLALFVRSH